MGSIIIITTPITHTGSPWAFLLQGIHVVCDSHHVYRRRSGGTRAPERGVCSFCVTAYSQCVAAKQAQMMVKNGDIGEIRVIAAEYPMGWLATEIENEGNKQASWRTDPKFSGPSNCVGDIGTHVEHTVSYITGLEIEELSARLDNIGGTNRALDTNAMIMVKYTNGAVGTYWCSQVAIGYDNALTVRIFGTKGSIEWRQEDPNYLSVAMIGEPKQRLSRGNAIILRRQQ